MTEDTGGRYGRKDDESDGEATAQEEGEPSIGSRLRAEAPAPEDHEEEVAAAV